MKDLTFALIIFFLFSLLLNYIYNTSKKNAIQIVNLMGQGYNLGNIFDSFSSFEEIKTPNDQITLWGNVAPTKEIILSIKKYGFKTIRFPITWLHFMDNNGKVNSEWMSRVKEVVDWIINAKMFCILDVHHDGASGQWLSEGIISKPKYIYLWAQIAIEFKDYDDQYLIFESMNEASYFIGSSYDYNTLYELTQAFIDTIRSSGGKNIDRLLLIPGANTDLDLTCNLNFKIPKDPSDKLAISIHYYYPTQFTLEPDDSPWTFIESGIVYEIPPLKNWGDEANYNDMIDYFEKLKKYFVDKGIPVIIGEVGVLTKQQKNIESIREYLNAVFSMSSDYNGIMSCLWDTSDKNIGDMNFYNRETNEWYDEIIRNNFKKISKEKNVKISEYFIYSKTKTVSSPDGNGNMNINIGEKKPLKIIFNVKIIKFSVSSIVFGLFTSQLNGEWTGYRINQGEGKKEFDGSYTFNVDVSNLDFYMFIETDVWVGKQYITFNYLTIEFKEFEISINYNDYKLALLKSINNKL